MAGEGRAKIIIDADAAKVIAEAIKGGKAIEGMAKKTKSIGDEFTRAITKVELFKKAVQTAGQALDAAFDKAEKFSRSGGAGNVSVAASFAALGSTNIAGSVEKFRNIQGSNTAEENERFLATLVSNNKDSRNPINSDTAQGAAEAFAVGGSIYYGPGGIELSNNLKNGMTLDQAKAASAALRPGLPALTNFPDNPIMTELGLRTGESTSAMATEKGQIAQGNKQRRGAIQYAYDNADIGHGAFVREGVDAIPGVKGVFDSWKGGGKTAADAAIIQTANEMRKLNASVSRPALAPGAERSP